MAFDGITISNIVSELKSKLIGGRVDKVYQPEADEIILGIRSFGSQYKLLLTANASHPRLQLTEISKQNPATPPLFCMVLRKHIQSGKIIDITQPNFERIINIYIESLNEMGDYSIKKLVLEVMGRHSNLILVDQNETILDCAKHITHDTSSVREVLPGKKYELPPSKDKLDTLSLSKDNFYSALENKPEKQLQAIIYQTYNGISPIIACEMCYKAGVDYTKVAKELSQAEKDSVYNSFNNVVDIIRSESFTPQILYDENNKIIDFSAIDMLQFGNVTKKSFDSMSALVEYFYASKDSTYRMNQKTHDLRRLIAQNIERCIKKSEIQQNTLKSIENRETQRLYGELLTANIYSIKKGMTSIELQNFYSPEYETIVIPLDATLTPSENAQRYFKKYNKAKRTLLALDVQIKANNEELNYLESVLTSVENCTDEQDIKEIREELNSEGFIKKLKAQKGKQQVKKSHPLHFISSDGFDIYVGKNNKQNDELTLKQAKPNDIWFHTKIIPGSHVIVVTEGKAVPETTLAEAATLAAYYSKAQTSSLVPVDYTEKRNVKKPNGAKPGLVIYETNQTAYITPTEEAINKLKKID